MLTFFDSCSRIKVNFIVIAQSPDTKKLSAKSSKVQINVHIYKDMKYI